MKTILSIPSRSGTALLAVLVVAFAVSGLLVVVTQASSQRSFAAQRLAARVRAQAIAETGVSYGYRLLSEDFARSTNATLISKTEYGGGVYEVTCLPVGNDKAVLTSQATYRGVDQQVVVDVDYHPPDLPDSPESAYEFAILSDDDMTFTGSGTLDVGGGRIHTNGRYKMTGCSLAMSNVSSCVQIWSTGTSDIDGDAYAPKYRGKSPHNVTGTAYVQTVDQVPIPEIDLTPYYNYAAAHGEVHSGGLNISQGYSPKGGICWVDGDLQISGTAPIHGSYIATGDIHCSGSYSHTKEKNYPGFVSRDGDIMFSGSGSFEGLVYTRTGNVKITGSLALHGAIICGGEFRKTGCSGVIAYVRSVPVAPNASPTDGVLCVSAWQE